MTEQFPFFLCLIITIVALVMIEILHKQYEGKWENSPVLQQLEAKWKGKSSADSDLAISLDYKGIYLDLLEKQRLWLIEKNNADEDFDEDIIRKHLRLIDIEEEKINSI